MRFIVGNQKPNSFQGLRGPRRLSQLSSARLCLEVNIAVVTNDRLGLIGRLRQSRSLGEGVRANRC